MEEKEEGHVIIDIKGQEVRGMVTALGWVSHEIKRDDAVRFGYISVQFLHFDQGSLDL